MFSPFSVLSAVSVSISLINCCSRRNCCYCQSAVSKGFFFETEVLAWEAKTATPFPGRVFFLGGEKKLSIWQKYSSTGWINCEGVGEEQLKLSKSKLKKKYLKFK